MYSILFQDKAKSMLHLYNRLGKSDLVMPGRELVKEGELERIFRSKTVARYFILLSDCLDDRRFPLLHAGLLGCFLI